MKVEIDKVEKQTPEDIYKLGNVFVAEDNNLYLVSHLENGGYCLVNLTLNQVVAQVRTPLDLIEKEYRTTDKLIDVKIVRA
ncbi:hypothetical protein WOSG25_290070 [Weissella oryzae SG25]|uniref:Uncharacterized protein n=1 Tax=Weissella oryzae (strain DSM 25784 / JCM 18191 / LMG 30913 / SG25) TaxID=1329250 RepID=A0A069CU15_WEIOS|nr:hypothetical protein [Weissella oryzae]GAK30718.1 hypothetical protein WOSG25_041590 [Weissella oryzae SG25]GAK32073.1 hypothetical protein WOSG25_290070 [Weissella oryzae SG25]